MVGLFCLYNPFVWQEMLRAHKVDFSDCFEVSELRDRLKETYSRGKSDLR